MRRWSDLIDLLYAAALGLVAGFIPVYMGLMPLRFFRRMSGGWRTLLVSFSAGILLFLFADVTQQAVKLSGVPGSSPALFAVGLTLGLLGPAVLSHWRRRSASAIQPGQAGSPPTAANGGTKIFTAYMIAMGIGLHNLGEGLAIGASYAAGALGLTAILVIGFALHNSTEGLGIAAPISALRTGLKDPMLLGFLAGFPTILGSLIGSVAYSAPLGALFFAAAAGALLFVIMELVKLTYTSERMVNALAGIMLGILVMFFTGLLVP